MWRNRRSQKRAEPRSSFHPSRRRSGEETGARRCGDLWGVEASKLTDSLPPRGSPRNSLQQSLDECMYCVQDFNFQKKVCARCKRLQAEPRKFLLGLCHSWIFSNAKQLNACCRKTKITSNYLVAEQVHDAFFRPSVIRPLQHSPNNNN